MARHETCQPSAKTGFAIKTWGQLPINGLRHPATEATSGWFIWCGEEFSLDRDFFVPLCTEHIYADWPQISRFLGLPPGYRFLIAGDYADVWFDPELLKIE